MNMIVPARAAAVTRRHKAWTVNGAARPARPALAGVALTRRYEVSWLDDDGVAESFSRVAPAVPAFEAAFSAFAHGAVIPTTEGPVAVEDLMPGTGVETADGSVAILRWAGAMTLIPGAPQTGDRPNRLYRVTADALGFARPSSDVTFGPSARLLNRDSSVRAAMGADGALAPVDSFEDGVGVAALNPISPVRVYHLGFDGHHVLKVGGIEVESYHPGADLPHVLSPDLLAVFLSLFPHKASLAAFGGLAAPRFEFSETGFELV